MSEIVTASISRTLVDLGDDASYWADVANGLPVGDWRGRTPDDVRIATIGVIETRRAAGERFQDIARSVTMSGDAILFTATARRL